MKSPLKVRVKLNHPLLPILLIILLVVKFLDPYPGWAVLLVGLGSAWLIAFIWARSLAGGLRLRREVRYGWAQVGDHLEERFTLINHSFFPALWAEVIDHTDMPGYSAGAATGVGGFSENRWQTEGICTRRGLFTHGPTELRSGDPFGIFTVEIIDPTTVNLLVTPPVAPLAQVPVQVGGWSEVGKPQIRSMEKTFDAATIRPYIPGDQPRWIHWKTTARRAELYVRIFSGAPAGDWWVILDLDTAVQLGDDQNTTLEHAIILAASLTSHGLHLGKAVGMCINSEVPAWLAPRSGDKARWEILRLLALASPASRSLGEFSISLPSTNNRKASYVIITANTDLSWLQPFLPRSSGTFKPTVLLLDPQNYGGEKSAQICRQTLQQFGIPAHIVPREIFTQIETRPGRQGIYQWRVTPMGRAVRVDPTPDPGWRKFT